MPKFSWQASDDQPVVVNIWDVAAVKNNLDDVVKATTLEKAEGFRELFHITDTKLGLSTGACAFALLAVIYGYLIPHPDSSLVVGVCVVGYFVLVGVLSLHAMFVEKNVLLVADRNSAKDKLILETSMPRFSHVYSVNLTIIKDQKETFNISKKWSIEQLFFEDGEVSRAAVDQAIEDLVKGCLASKVGDKKDD
eukprot:m.267691 g.267691  ORF g.267691 m.267691 type:complete len:194 (-) comp33948_c0_seq1:100-681(-)